jgi:hypothetical protein
MSRVYQASPGGPLRRAWTTNDTSSAFAAPAPTNTKPSGDGVIDLAAVPPLWVRVLPFGEGANDTTFDQRLVGWSLVGVTWVPVILCQYSVTLSTAVGVAGGDVLATERFADAVSDPATNLGTTGVDCQPKSPQNNTPAHYLIDAVGCTVFKIENDMTGATSGNALVGPA